MPPLGNLYNVPVYVDRALTEDLEIVFQAGSHRDTMKIAYKDYARLVKPVVADFATHL
jgi:Ala-tRNA(Pro) deacylase